MPCLRRPPERTSASKAPKRVLRIRAVASIAGSQGVGGVYHQIPNYRKGSCRTSPHACFPVSCLNSNSWTIRNKTAIDHTVTIAPQTASRQCRRARACAPNAPDTKLSLKPEKKRRIKNEQVRKVFSSRNRFRAPCDFCPHSRDHGESSCQQWRL